MTAAHVAGLPVEELFPMAAFAGGALVVARTWVELRLRRLRRRAGVAAGALEAARSSSIGPETRRHQPQTPSGQEPGGV